MNNQALNDAFADLSTPLLADACLRLGVSYRVAPSGLRPVMRGNRVAGRVLPVRHYGSVDVFLEALIDATPGDVLTVDNGGRTDEGCIGDLTALEVQANGLAALIVWGVHRDTSELVRIGFPVFSYGAVPTGPLRLDPREPDALTSAQFGSFTVSKEDAVFADDDGAIFAPFQHADKLIDCARAIRQTERRQADAIRQGTTLHQQLRFADFLAGRNADPTYTFRTHLREIGGAIEE
ncbi:MAG: RraA family protein [Rhodothermales bacterium]